MIMFRASLAGLALCAGAAFSGETVVPEFGNGLTVYNCIKQTYDSCEGVEDIRRILASHTDLDVLTIDDLILAETNGSPTGLPGQMNCQVTLSFIARALFHGEVGAEPNICAARDISEYLIEHRWTPEYPVGPGFGSTAIEPWGSLDVLYLADWAAIRASEGQKTAQCILGIRQLENAVEAHRQLVPPDAWPGFTDKIEEVVPLQIFHHVVAAIQTLEHSAKPPHANPYSAFVIDQISDIEFPYDEDSKAIVPQFPFGGDGLCSGE